jgi:hypothetical protein
MLLCLSEQDIVESDVEERDFEDTVASGWIRGAAADENQYPWLQRLCQFLAHIPPPGVPFVGLQSPNPAAY